VPQVGAKSKSRSRSGILVVAAVVAVAFALASIGKVLLLIFVSIFSVAVLSPVVDAMERRLPWSRALCATVLVLGIAVVGIGVVLVLLQAIVDGVRNFSDACRRWWTRPATATSVV
jgi:predicted PurR-regulated permease PerM